MKIRLFNLAEWCLAILLSLAVLFLLVVRARHAGALWRDECASLQVAVIPTLHDLLQNFQRESFPASFYLLLRGYTAILGTSDNVLRLLGFGVGVMLLAATWINSRLLMNEPPLVAIALLGLNTTFLFWGTTIRAYGIGTVLSLLIFGLIAGVLIKPTSYRIAGAFVAALAAVQMLFYNSVIFMAMAFVVIAICWVRRRWTAAFAVVGIGLLCGISMLIYVRPFWNESEATIVLRGPPLDLSWFWNELKPAFGNPPGVMTSVWITVFAAATIGSVIRIWLIWPTKLAPEWDLLLFGLLAPVTSVIGYFFFLKIVGYGTREWYYLALLSVLAGAIDLLVANLARIIAWIRGLRLVFAAAALFALPLFAWPKIIERQTNMDLVAQRLEESADTHDLIVANPWYYGISFNWYYKGPTPWTTVPIMGDHRVHRFDLLKTKMITPNPIDDLRDQITDTLKSGGRVWFVGGVWFLPEGEEPVDLPPAPGSEFGWSTDAYADFWSQQIGVFLRNHTFGGEVIRIRASGPVNELEHLDLLVIHGWRE